jgi:hypothetical protein
MEHISIATGKLINTWQQTGRAKQELTVKSSLAKILSKKEQRHIRFHSLKEGQIILRADSSAWMYIINIKKEQLLKKLNQTLKPAQAVGRITLRLNRDEAKG